jgi:type I restriction enzyme S subunit
MSKENKHALSGAEGLIPEMRFPEFANEAEWKLERLGNLANTTIGEFVIKTKQHPDSLYPVYNGGKSYTGFYDEYNNEENKIVISARGANAGFVNLVKQKYWAGNSCYSVGVLDPNRIDLDLLFYYVKHNQRRFTDNQQAANIPSVSKGDVEKFQICFPDNPQEQQKIASCLSSLDELIAAHNDKLDALKDHKKGLLQNLFPQEGETVPKLRFPDFERDGEWVEDDIGSIFKFKQGVQVPVGNQFPEQGDDMVRFIRIIDITSNTEPPRYIENPGDAHIINKDDLFMIRYGTPGLISIGFEGVIANNLFRLIWKSKKRNHPKYWFYAFQRLESFIYNLSSSSSMPAISFSTLEDLKIGFPPTIHEQQKIASCLSAVDELITAQQEKIEQLQQHKKGLMQGLFPKIES